MFLLLSSVNKRPVAGYSFSGIPSPLELTGLGHGLVGLMASSPLIAFDQPPATTKTT